MRHGQTLRRTALIIASLTIMNAANAQERQMRSFHPVAGSQGDKQPGIQTDRLTAKQFRIWKSIESVVFAQDGAGRPLHPTLLDLWQRVQANGQTIYIELSEKKVDATHNVAGVFVPGKTGPDGRNSAGVIQLSLWVIDNARKAREERRDGGYVRFEGLRRIECYAEVLGHELAHAVATLEDPDYARLAREMDSETDQFLLSRKPSRSGRSYDEETRLRLSRIRELSDLIEDPAIRTEGKVWRELRESRRGSLARFLAVSVPEIMSIVNWHSSRL